MKPTYDELLATLERLTIIADECVTIMWGRSVPDKELNEVVSAINESSQMIHLAKGGENKP